MPFDLTNFRDENLDAEYLAYLVDHQATENEAFHNRLWNYYRNPLLPVLGIGTSTLNENSRPYLLAQEVGLPARITGVRRFGAVEPLTDVRRKEVVIENDIAWRVQTMVDFLFGRDVTIRSRADDPAVARSVEEILAALLDANGGVALLQEMALLAGVYGFVDVALRIPADRPAFHPSLPTPPNTGRPDDPSAGGQDTREDRSKSRLARAVDSARMIRLETVEASRILPILAEDDYRETRYWVQRYAKSPSRMASGRRGWLGFGRAQTPTPQIVEVIEILSPTWWQRYEDRRLAAEGPNALGRIPVVHIQNLASPGTYSGFSDVEPLIALQDELNTRLSDRANRVTYQSFKMYLGKGIDDFLERPVGPGQMWATHNLEADIQEFGSDEGSPSEDAHIEQVRQALDKTSGVTPLAAGLIRGEVGNLTSATALKVVLSGLLAKTARKRLTFGAGLAEIASLTLHWLDRSGVLATRPEDRNIEVHWPDPLPSDETELLRRAEIKRQLGVPTERVLAELGYAPPEES